MFEPIKVNADAPAIESERVPAFVITTDGEDKTYTVPKEISGPTSLLALEVFVNRGETATVLWLARHALGADGMDAVLTCEQLTLTDAQNLINRIGQHYLGQVKDLGKAQA
jgi:hypothetical protein